MAAVERSLIEMCGVPQQAIAAMAQGMTENLVQLVLSKVRDEIGVGDSNAFESIVGDTMAGESSDALRRLMSVWYYFFPSDQHVRRGDLIEINGDGDLGLVVTPVCDLEKFPKKTGRRLTWLSCVFLDKAGRDSLRASGYEFNGVGNSIVANHGKASALVLLPNVPLLAGERKSLADYVLMCHAWESRLFEGIEGGSLTYDKLGGQLRRRCTLAMPFAEAVVAKAMTIMSALGTPDLPKGELIRLRELL